MAELNGRPVRSAELQTLALTNYGHFTTMRVEAGRVRGLGLHLERLVRDCRAVFGTELDPERVRAYARRAVPGDGPVVVRVTVFDPALDVGHIGADAHPRVLVTTRPAGSLALPPLRVRSVRYLRDQPAVKSVGLFGALRHRREAQRAGFDDALFVDAESAVSEGGTWNIAFVRGSQVVRPDADCLVGTTMELLQQVRPGATERVTLERAAGFDAAFATNAAIGVRAVSGLDGLAFPADHPVIAELAGEYAALPGELL
ncbi:aminotransferase class IV family protein [Kitasatospora atroaurantiaca]|uniref:Branched-subunit amino acid aminotransferase/4-amino-4-deoxychorismate lyase n=1 Tax=Kitasatospora atroaurantiaca TaxID=285545 RepID=A0A561ELF5_9ACTN|nr:aminotransferase class IV family protein [Kitasatospora atroaurantiaca]TWE16402.1 branched-subunit amino acid aminotransferase/4-amino-4-deoxychorismate lyase [Kitasatospora atroaurantiaca]